MLASVAHAAWFVSHNLITPYYDIQEHTEIKQQEVQEARCIGYLYYCHRNENLSTIDG